MPEIAIALAPGPARAFCPTVHAASCPTRYRRLSTGVTGSSPRSAPPGFPSLFRGKSPRSNTRQKPPGEFDLLAFRKGLIERGRGSQRNSPIYPRNHADFRGMATMSRPQTPHSDGTWPPAMELSILRGGGGRGVTYHRDRRGGRGTQGVPPRTLTSGLPQRPGALHIRHRSGADISNQYQSKDPYRSVRHQSSLRGWKRVLVGAVRSLDRVAFQFREGHEGNRAPIVDIRACHAGRYFQSISVKRSIPFCSASIFASGVETGSSRRGAFP